VTYKLLKLWTKENSKLRVLRSSTLNKALFFLPSFSTTCLLATQHMKWFLPEKSICHFKRTNTCERTKNNKQNWHLWYLIFASASSKPRLHINNRTSVSWRSLGAPIPFVSLPVPDVIVHRTKSLRSSLLWLLSILLLRRPAWLPPKLPPYSFSFRILLYSYHFHL
jgi:hypothetical protein